MSTPSSARTIGLFAYDDMQVLDLAGPLDVFGGANTLAHGAPPYGLCVIGLQARAVHAENGLSVVPAYTLDDAPPLDTLLVPGGIAARLALHDGENGVRRKRGQVHFCGLSERGGRCAGRTPANRWVLASTMARKSSRPSARCCWR